MYLSKKTYVKNWDHNPKMKHKITIKLNNKIRKDIKAERVSQITEDVMYWRKANHIHAWFVENCQGGEDDCRSSWVSREQLEELATLCEEVLKFKADGKSPKETLPTQGGFFFGDTEYGEYYYEECRETAETIRAILKEEQVKDAFPGEFYYQASW
jgi:hypothetical protein